MIEGMIEADTETAAISRLGHHGMFPISIMEIGAESLAPQPKAARRISPQTLAYMTHQLADLLGGGLPLLSALTLLAKQTEHARLRRVIESLAASVRDGRSLSEAIAEHPTLFPPLYRSMVKAGEAGGALEPALKRLAELGESEAELHSKIQSAAAYPIFVLCVAAAMTTFLIAYVIPKLSAVFVETGQLLPLPTRMLLAVSAVMTQWWWLLLLAILVMGWGIRQWASSSAGQAILDRLILRVPGVGPLVRKLEAARVARNLGTLIGQGIPILQALDVVAHSVANSILRTAVEGMRTTVQEGSTLAAAVAGTGQFQIFVSNMVAVGEESGTVDAALLKVASAYERDVDRTIRNLTTILEPLLLVVVGGIVMFIVLAMLLPVFQIGLVVQ